MFGKARELSDQETLDAATIRNGILGDEDAAQRTAELHELHVRLESIESQLHSQFTSMAAYAQIAHEQVELARAESRAENDQLERRVTRLIERERADRLGGSESSGRPDVEARLDALDRAVTELRSGLAECLTRQKALADAITALFEPAPTAVLPALPAVPPPPGERPAPAVATAGLPAPATGAVPTVAAQGSATGDGWAPPAPAGGGGPIAGLSLR